jgi:hypothetical protein
MASGPPPDLVLNNYPKPLHSLVRQVNKVVQNTAQAKQNNDRLPPNAQNHACNPAYHSAVAVRTVFQNSTLQFISGLEENIFDLDVSIPILTILK